MEIFNEYKKAQNIECDDIIPVTELINIQLKNRLKGPLKIINTHYELSNDYFNIIEQVKSKFYLVLNQENILYRFTK